MSAAVESADRRPSAVTQAPVEALERARVDLAADESREFRRQGMVLRAYLGAAMAVATGYAVYFWSLRESPWADPAYGWAAVAALAVALGMAAALLFDLRGHRATAAILSQTVTIAPVVYCSAVFSVEAGFGSYLFIGALGVVVFVPEGRQRTRVAIVATLVLAIVVMQVLFTAANAIAPLPAAQSAALTTFNRTVMTITLFALAFL